MFTVLVTVAVLVTSIMQVQSLAIERSVNSVGYDIIEGHPKRSENAEVKMGDDPSSRPDDTGGPYPYEDHAGALGKTANGYLGYPEPPNCKDDDVYHFFFSYYDETARESGVVGRKEYNRWREVRQMYFTAMKDFDNYSGVLDYGNGSSYNVEVWRPVRLINNCVTGTVTHKLPNSTSFVTYHGPFIMVAACRLSAIRRQYNELSAFASNGPKEAADVQKAMGMLCRHAADTAYLIRSTEDYRKDQREKEKLDKEKLDKEKGVKCEYKGCGWIPPRRPAQPQQRSPIKPSRES